MILLWLAWGVNNNVIEELPKTVTSLLLGVLDLGSSIKQISGSRLIGTADNDPIQGLARFLTILAARHTEGNCKQIPGAWFEIELPS